MNPQEKKHPPAVTLNYHEVGGWQELDHVASFSCFLVSARKLQERLPKRGLLGTDPGQLAKIGERALELAAQNRNAQGKLVLSNDMARQFFEQEFIPVRYSAYSFTGFVTGYYEPEVAASRRRHGSYQFPIYGRPDDLVKLNDTNRPASLSSSFEWGRKTGEGIVEYHDRKAIDNGALKGKGYELYWLKDKVDAFFIHIQGSARLALDDGSHARISFAGKSGHPYTPIGKILIERGEIAREDISMDSIRDWLKRHPEKVDEVLQQNRSFIFFTDSGNETLVNAGPIAAAEVPLTPGYSLAVDRMLHTFGTPVMIRTAMALPWEKTPLSRLMIAQDTGSAIVGPQRGDLFFGSGSEAGQMAGRIKHKADFIFLKPAGSEANSQKDAG